MSALGYETIPAIFFRSHVVDIEMARHWPNVRNGLWTREQAEAYFHHLFDFDSLAWAREQGYVQKLDPQQGPREGAADGARRRRLAL